MDYHDRMIRRVLSKSEIESLILTVKTDLTHKYESMIYEYGCKI